MKDTRGGRKLGSATGDIVCWPPLVLTLHLKAIMTGKGWVGAGKEHEMEIYRRGGRDRDSQGEKEEREIRSLI
jgi:hypothetical protein